MTMPRYPVYVPTKGRVDVCYTTRFLLRDRVPFLLVVEPQEYDVYAARFGPSCVLTLPFSNLGQGSIPARNWIKAHATAAGHERHWQLDDNLRETFRYYKGSRLPCDSGLALRVVEDFVDRYENVAIAGLNYTMFAVSQPPPFYLNGRVYSCMLVDNTIPYQWRGRYNEDTDLCLQVLSGGWCTALVSAFLVEKKTTMTMRGGNTTELYSDDGRLTMARSLERMWPGVVTTKRRYGRPQHVVNWRKFDTPLKLKPGIDLSTMTPNEYGMRLVQVKPEVKSAALRDLLARESAQTG